MPGIFDAIKQNDFTKFETHFHDATLDTILLATLRHGRLKMLQHCLQKGAAIPAEAFDTAIKYGHTHVARYLVTVGTFDHQVVLEVTNHDLQAAFIAAVVQRQNRVFDLVERRFKTGGSLVDRIVAIAKRKVVTHDARREDMAPL